MGEAEAGIGCRMWEQRIGNARNDLDGWFMGHGREEFCNDLAKRRAP